MIEFQRLAQKLGAVGLSIGAYAARGANRYFVYDNQNTYCMVGAVAVVDNRVYCFMYGVSGMPNDVEHFATYVEELWPVVPIESVMLLGDGSAEHAVVLLQAGAAMRKAAVLQGGDEGREGTIKGLLRGIHRAK